MKSIFEFETIMDKNIKLCTVFSYCTNLDCYEEDGLPEKICETCKRDIIIAFTVKQQFIRANAILREHLVAVAKAVEEQDRCVAVKFENIFVGEDNNPNSTNHQIEEFGFVDYGNGEQPDSDQNDSENESLAQKRKEILTKLSGVHGDAATKSEVTDRAIRKYLKSKSITGSTTNKRISKADHNTNFKCVVCEKVLKSAGSLKFHMMGHTNTTPFLCSICGQGFKRRTSHKEHMLLVHNPENPNKCKECGKMYRSERTLKDHYKRAHAPQKPFLCGICGKGLTQKDALQKHMMIHTGEKPFECDQCGKHFRYKNVLVLHKRYHSGERPYSCPECQQTFIGKSHYRTHMLIHTGAKPFECDICGKCFNRRTNLRSHRKIHTGERSHFCPVCGKGFIQKNAMNAHMVSHDKPATGGDRSVKSKPLANKVKVMKQEIVILTPIVQQQTTTDMVINRETYETNTEHPQEEYLEERW